MTRIEKQDLLRQGDYVITRDSRRIYTVLGSCVAVTLHCPRTGDSAICHGMLSRPHGDKVGGVPAAQTGRYLSEVLPLMLATLRSRGCLPSEIEAKVFGGASLMPRSPQGAADLEVGLENVQEALRLLLDAGLRVRGSNTGGALAHRIIFDTASGEVLHQLLKQGSLNPFEAP